MAAIVHLVAAALKQLNGGAGASLSDITAFVRERYTGDDKAGLNLLVGQRLEAGVTEGLHFSWEGPGFEPYFCLVGRKNTSQELLNHFLEDIL